MAHPEQIAYCLSVANRWPHHFTRKRVLDVGSLDVNGCNRSLFTDCEYLGLDVVAGRNVDIVGQVEDAPGNFDTIICTEVFEHDHGWRQTLHQMVGKLRNGGLLLVTCAGPGRPEHGTIRRPIRGMVCTSNYYHNIGHSQLSDALGVYPWRYVEVVYEAEPSADVRATCIRKP